MKKIDEMKQKLEGLKNTAQVLLNENKITDAKAKMNEIKELKAAIEIQKELDEEEQAVIVNKVKEKPKKNVVMDKIEVFLNAMKSPIDGRRLSSEEKEILNATTMTEGIPADGGLTVPKDVRTDIKELRKTDDALELLVNVERTTTLEGTRVIEVGADHTPFDNVEEGAQFPDISTPTFKDLAYKVKKKGGILKLTRELLQDSNAALLKYLKKWIATKAKATRNALIVAKLKEIWVTKVVITDIDDLKDIVDITLDPAYESTSIVLLNQDGYNYLNKLKDANGDYILQKDVTSSTKKLLFGLYPIKKVSNKVLPTTAGKAPVFIGDLKEAITIFDRETLTIEFNDKSDTLWNNDKIGMKVRERLDIQVVVEEAIVAGEITLPAK